MNTFEYRDASHCVGSLVRSHSCKHSAPLTPLVNRVATLDELKKLWEYNIKIHANDIRWINWQTEAIENHVTGKSKTFIIFKDTKPIGEITLIISPECQAVKNRPLLCNGKNIANINAIRIMKEYEGQGHISKLLKVVEQYAKKNRINILTIGVDAHETRNIAIYLHWGYNKFVMHEIEDNSLVLYYQKDITK